MIGPAAQACNRVFLQIRNRTHRKNCQNINYQNINVFGIDPREITMSKLPAHKVTGVKEAIETAGTTRLFLPPYSPDFNPIQNAFAKLKALLRMTAARTVEDLWAAIAETIELFPPGECTNFFGNSGYKEYWSESVLGV